MPKSQTSSDLLKNQLKIEQWPIERLIPYARNPRKNDAVVDKMVSAIKEFGFRIPIVAKSDGSVVDGHLRLKAARKLGMAEVPVALADELTDAQVKAFRLLANRSVEWAEWDNDLLKLELDELREMDFDLELTGFDSNLLSELLADAATTDFPEIPDEDVVKLSYITLNFENPDKRDEALGIIENFKKAHGIKQNGQAVLELLRDAVNGI